MIDGRIVQDINGKPIVENIGNVNILGTSVKSSVVSAINEVLNNVGNNSNLKTNVKDSLVNAVNEVIDKIDLLKRKTDFVIDVRDFGAINAVNDHTSIVQSAIDYAKSLGGGIVLCPPATYKFTGLNILKLYSNVELKGIKGLTTFDFSKRSGSTADLGYKYLVSASGSFENGVKLIADAQVNQNIIQVNTSGFKEKDLLIITSDAEWVELNSYNTKNGEYVIVDEILSSTKMRLKSATYDTYLISKNARVHRVNPVKNITIDGISFKGQGRLGSGATDGDLGIGFTYGQNITVRNCEFVDIDEIQLEFRSCYNFLAENNYHFHSKYFSPSGSVGENKPSPMSPIRGTVQYQVRSSDCSMYGKIRDCVGEGGRHLFNTGHSYRDMEGNPSQQVGKLFGINRHIRVENCYSKNTWHAGFSTHGDAEFVEFVSCTSENSGMAGFNPRSKQIRVFDCTAVNAKYGYLFSDFPQTAEIRNCKAINCSAYVSMVNVETNQVSLDYKNLTIEGCDFEGGSEGIFINVNSDSLNGELNINNNRISNTTITGIYCPIRVIGAWSDVNIEGNKIRNTNAGYNIRLEKVKRAVVQNNICKKGYRLMTALNDCEKVIVLNNTFAEHSYNTIDNNSKTPTNANNIII
ncbi:hypothetical protein WKH56_20930 [Priestia sp. SB1]|uniref:hypothetical protein n=1 Tax=Priestia sp. SB1 TaxID=3132359 RepID=UPI00316FB3FC